MTVWFFTFTYCLYEFITLKCRMDNSSLIRIHWFKNYRFSCFLNLIGNSSCQIFQSFFSASSVIFRVKLHSDVVSFSFIYNKAGKILERIQCLSSLADKDLFNSFYLNYSTAAFSFWLTSSTDFCHSATVF